MALFQLAAFTLLKREKCFLFYIHISQTKKLNSFPPHFLSSFSEKTGVKAGELFMSFKSIFQDVRRAIDFVHIKGNLKQKTIEVFQHFFYKSISIRKFTISFKTL